MATGWVWDERYAWHDTGHGAGALPVNGAIEPEDHVESPASKRRLRNLVEVSGLLDQLVRIKPRPATEEELLRLHTKEYVDSIRELSDSGGGRSDAETHVGRGSYEIALLAAGGCMEAVDAVIDGKVRNAYALVRPPGHHAEADRSCGFCIFGNTALAAMYARWARGLERVAIVDWDVHHGNGTEKAFYSDSSVLTVSVHQDNNFPVGSGNIDDTGEGDGEDYNINVPLPPGSGTGAYVAAFERVIVPAVRNYRPNLILVASGFDASALDPLGSQMLHSETYRQLTHILTQVADDVCEGRFVMCHEGGYSTAYVPFCGLAVLEELSGIRTSVEDPFLTELREWGYQDLQIHQEGVIRALEGRLSLQK